MIKSRSAVKGRSNKQRLRLHGLNLLTQPNPDEMVQPRQGLKDRLGAAVPALEDKTARDLAMSFSLRYSIVEK